MDKLSYFFKQLEELCQEIYQNSNSENYYQSEWNIKIPAQNVNKRNKQQTKCKRKQGHPTAIFGKMSVRKTIWDLEFSEHLL